MTGGQRNQENPVSGSDDTSLRRLGEQVRALFRSNIFLERLLPGNVKRGSSGVSVQLAWEEINRVELSTNASVKLPTVRPELIGVPLFLAKRSGTGIATITGSADAPLVDGSPTGVQRSVVGLSEFVSDGEQWFSVAGAVASGMQGDASFFKSISVATLLVDSSYARNLIECTHASGCQIIVGASLFNQNEWFDAYATQGQVSFVAGTGNTINKPTSLNRRTREAYSGAELRCTTPGASGIFWLNGDLEVT